MGVLCHMGTLDATVWFSKLSSHAGCDSLRGVLFGPQQALDRLYSMNFCGVGLFGLWASCPSSEAHLCSDGLPWLRRCSGRTPSTSVYFQRPLLLDVSYLVSWKSLFQYFLRFLIISSEASSCCTVSDGVCCSSLLLLCRFIFDFKSLLATELSSYGCMHFLLATFFRVFFIKSYLLQGRGT